MEENNVEVMPEVDQLKALLGEQANIMDALVRDNVELLAAFKMVMSDEVIASRLVEIKVMAILTNLMDRIAKDDSHAS